MEQEKLNKLPKWAQQEFVDIERKHEIAVAKLDEYINENQEGYFSIDDISTHGNKSCESSLVFLKHRVKGNNMKIHFKGVELDIFLDECSEKINLSYSLEDQHSPFGNDVLLQPVCHNKFSLSKHTNQ